MRENCNKGKVSCLLFWGVFFCGAAVAAAGGKKFAVEPMTQIAAEPFGAEAVRLLDGPFKRAQDANGTWLLALEPDRLLARFREYAGLEPKAKGYGGWEEATISGHSLGHYLSACSLMYASTGDERFRERAAYIVDELAAVQATYGDGYAMGIPNGRKAFEEVSRGDIRSKGFDLNGIWVPWYTTHKLMAGLRDACVLCDNPRAKAVLIGVADYAYGVTNKLSDEQIQKMLLCEHGGMNELCAEVYALTGDKKYLELAGRFNHRQVLDPLSRGEDRLAGFHANTQVPKIMGCARQYELTGDAYFKRAAEFFWETVVAHHTYVIGGNSNGEHFGEPGKLNDRLSDNTCETCNTYNMLKVTRQVYTWHASPRYMDYYERALYNHILASQYPETGQVCYFVSLKQGTMKEENRGYSTLFDSFWCCTGTGMENHAKYGDSIYFHKGDSLFVNLFIASRLDWREKGVRLVQETTLPESDRVRLRFDCEKATPLKMCIRYPAWAGAKTSVSINGQETPVAAAPGEYIVLERTWQKGDVIEAVFEMGVYSESMPDNPDRIALLYGPVVLAGDFGDARPEPWIPVLMTDDGRVSNWVRPVPDAKGGMTFRTANVGRPTDVTFVPFYSLHHRYYSIYFDRFTQAQWQKRQAEYEAEMQRKKELEARTADFFQPGEMQPERDHRLEGEKTRTGSHEGGKWRDAFDGGWFAFDMKVGEGPMDLLCTYWGSDSGGRRFDVMVDGEVVATQVLNRNRPGEFFEVAYPLPGALTRGKEKVRVMLRAHEGQMAGGLFGCRMLKHAE